MTVQVKRPDGTITAGYSAELTAEVLDVKNIGTRVFYKPAMTIRSAKTGEVIPPEKLAQNLIAKASLEIATLPGVRANKCGCGADLVKPKGGRYPTRCPACAVEENRRVAREHVRGRGLKTVERGRRKKSLPSAIAGMAKRAANARARQQKLRDERKAAGLCLSCGKAPGYQGTARCESCRAKRAKKTP